MSESPQANEPSKGGAKCVICKTPIERDAEFFPFCSKRCKLVDLGKWLGGEYKISRPAEQVTDD